MNIGRSSGGFSNSTESIFTKHRHVVDVGDMGKLNRQLRRPWRKQVESGAYISRSRKAGLL